jgi:putative transposase
MARPLRIEYPGAWYHVMNRGRRRETIFQSDPDYRSFMEVLGECVRLFKIEVHAYSLMTNHYHLLIRTPKANLSRAMRHLNGVYTQKINKRYRYEGSLFRGRYKSIVVEEDTYFKELLRYIHRNPLRAKVVRRIIDHKWTSHRSYMTSGEGPKWLSKDTALGKFGKYEKSAKQKMDAFVKQEVPKDLGNILERVKWPAMLGDKEFKEKIRGLIRGKEIEVREVPQCKEAERDMSADEVAAILVDKLEGWDKKVFGISKERRLVEKRRQFAYMCREYFHIPCRDICKTLGGVTFASISNYYSQSRLMAEESKEFINEIELLVWVVRKNLNIKT